MEIKVLYEDNHLIAVYKPAGVLIQKGEGEGYDDNTLYWQVKMFLKERDQKPGNVFLGVLHRLDRTVAGIVLFAKTSKGAARLSEQFRERTMKKVYRAVVVGVPASARGTLIHYFQKDEVAKKAVPDASGDRAVLHYQVITHNDNYALLRVELETGRFHQIRAQLSEIGHPIVGDVKYGAPEALPDRSIMLCATELTFRTATTDEEINLSLEMPQEWKGLLGQKGFDF